MDYSQTNSVVKRNRAILGGERADSRFLGSRSATVSPVATFVIVLFAIALTLPGDVSLWIGPLRVTFYRLIAIVMFVPALMHLFTGQCGRILLADVLMLLHGVWGFLAMMNWGGFSVALQSGGVYFLESFGIYLFARCYLRSERQLIAFTKTMFIAVLVVLPFAVYEAFTGHHLLLQIFRYIIGGRPIVETSVRMGLHRAYGSMDHPILFGVFCASLLGPAIYTLGRKTSSPGSFLRTAVIGAATFFSVSTGPFMMIIADIALMGWAFIMRRVAKKWVILALIVGAMWIAVSLLSNRDPLRVFIWYFSFDRNSAFYRLAIWDNGMAEVARHPFLGIGFGDWQRYEWMASDSVDAFWLLEAMRYGLPSVVFLAAAIVSLVIKVRKARLSERLHRHRVGWLLSVAGFIFAGFTVHYWNAVFCLFFFILGSGVWLINQRAN